MKKFFITLAVIVVVVIILQAVGKLLGQENVIKTIFNWLTNWVVTSVGGTAPGNML